MSGWSILMTGTIPLKLWLGGRGGWVGHCRLRVVDEGDILREVELGLVASETEGCLVVGPSRVLRGVEGAQPHPGCFVGIPNLGGPLPPRPLSHSSVLSRSSSTATWWRWRCWRVGVNCCCCCCCCCLCWSIHVLTSFCILYTIIISWNYFCMNFDTMYLKSHMHATLN